MTPLERAAAAIEAALGPDDTICSTPKDVVRAVLTAIREPSEDMISVGGDDFDTAVPNEVEGLWQAMIDAALAEAA